MPGSKSQVIVLRAPPRRRARGRRRQGGKFSFGKLVKGLSKANNFLRGTKLISRTANALGSAGVPYASQIGSTAGVLGYGVQRRRRGRGRVGGRNVILV